MAHRGDYVALSSWSPNQRTAQRNTVVGDKEMNMTRKEWRDIARQAQRLAQRGDLITAIKLLRVKTACGLKDAWTAVKDLRAMERIR